jgi:hypothetical protein
MCPDGQKELFDRRFWLIELFDLNFPLRKKGVMVWDNEKEKLYGPFVEEGVALESYKFLKTVSEVELYLYFTGQVDNCVSGFDKEKQTYANLS